MKRKTKNSEGGEEGGEEEAKMSLKLEVADEENTIIDSWKWKSDV